jgi:hypothetical protein
VQANQPVNFDFSVSGVPAGVTPTIQLSYGDGSSDPLSAASGTASHSYASGGSYPAIVTVSDQTGQILGAASIIIAVGG